MFFDQVTRGGQPFRYLHTNAAGADGVVEGMRFVESAAIEMGAPRSPPF